MANAGMANDAGGRSLLCRRTLLFALDADLDEE
jgi:hypothetical protein